MMPFKQKQKSTLSIIGLAAILLWPFNLSAANGNEAPEIKNLNQKIEEQRQANDALQKKIEVYEQKIQAKQNQAFTIKNQISEIDERIDKTKTELEIKRGQIMELNLRLEQTKGRLEEKEKEIAKQKERLGELLRLLYRRGERNYVKILLASDAFSEFFDQTQYLRKVEEHAGTLLSTLAAMKAKLEAEKAEMEQQKESLQKLREQLSGTQEQLKEQSTAKNVLLEATRNDEAKFQQLLREVRVEQAQINATIVGLERQLREKLAAAGDKTLAGLSGQKFAWPVPSRTITSGFHDPDYPFRRYFEHPAIDIRASQGTPIRAIGSGYVSVTRDGGMGYSYISLIHGDGFSSVYGHVSCITAKAEEYVAQGQVIGCSGGTPGTPGAGRLTTGAHLHLEIRLKGIPVNPVNYLP